MKKISELESPVLAGVVRECEKNKAIALIKNCLCDGANIIDLHLSCLENRDKKSLRSIISASKLPVLALNYNSHSDWSPCGMDEDERTALLLDAVECGAAGSLSRIINPILGGHIIFCVDGYNEYSTMEQLDLKSVKAIVDNMKKI